VFKKISNCKVLAKRILAYKLDKIQERIRLNNAKLLDFFKTTYKGLYCGVCDYDNHKYFDQKKFEINFSDRFCRSIIENTFSSLILYKVDMVKLLNIVTRFLTQCDFRGEFDYQAKLPNEFIFSVPEEDKYEITKCRDNINNQFWLSYCKPICKKFSMYEYADYFEPNIALIYDYNEYLHETIKKKFKEEMVFPIANKYLYNKMPKELKEKMPRQLQEQDEKKMNEIELRDKAIYTKGLAQRVNLAIWTTDYLEDGFDPYSVGLASAISETNYNEVRTYFGLTQKDSGIHQAAVLSSEDAKIKDKFIGDRRKLKAKKQKKTEKIQKEESTGFFGFLKHWFG